MKTKNLIQMNANVIKITNLKKGDVVKILDEDYSSIKTSYGVVIDLMNTGEKSFIQILKYTKSYDEIKAVIETYDGDKDLNIFPTTVEEVKNELDSSLKSIKESIEKDKENLQKKIDGYKKGEEFVSGEMSKKLLEVSYEEITQKDYETKKELQRKKIEELQDIN